MLASACPRPVRTATAVLLALYAGLALCAYPSVDDWYFAAAGREHGIVAGVYDHVVGWGGRWLAVAITLSWLGHAGAVALYPLACLIALAGIVATGWLLARLEGIAGWWGVAAGVVLLAAIAQPGHGPYWLCAASAYIVPLPLIAGLILLPSGRWAAPVAVAGGIAIAGCSETAAVEAVLAGLGAWASGRRHGLALAVGAVAGVVLTLVAPGTRIRLATLHGEAGPGLLDRLPAAAWTATADGVRQVVDWALSPLAVAAVALAGQAIPRRPAAGWRPPAIALVLMLLAAVLGRLPAQLGVGMVESRQTALIALAVAGWWLVGAGALARWRELPPLAILVWWSAAVGWTLMDGPAASPALWIISGVLGAAGLLAIHAGQPAWLLAAGLLLQPAVQRAVDDAGGPAPMRRLEQARRDAAVARLAAAGVRAVVVPVPDPAWFPATISPGDLGTGRAWWNDGYATWHGLESVRVDPRAGLVAPDPRR